MSRTHSVFRAAVLTIVVMACGDIAKAVTETSSASPAVLTPSANCAHEISEGKVSDACRAEALRFLKASQQAQDQNDGSLATIGALSAPNPPFPVMIVETSYFAESPKLRTGRFNLASPLSASADETWSGSLAAGRISVADQPPLLGTAKVPENLDRVEASLQYEKKLSGYRRWSLKGSAGSASDQLFSKFGDTLFSVTAQYGYPTDGGHYLSWFVFISNNSSIGNYIPIPGFIYVYKTKNFTGLFGIPIVSLQWNLAPRVDYSFTMTGPSATTELAYGALKTVQGFLGASWTNQPFLLHDRKEDLDRLTVEDKRVYFGVRTFAFDRMILEAQAGRSFDRMIYSGKGFRNYEGGKYDAPSDAFVTLLLKTRF